MKQMSMFLKHIVRSGIKKQRKQVCSWMRLNENLQLNRSAKSVYFADLCIMNNRIEYHHQCKNDHVN